MPWEQVGNKESKFMGKWDDWKEVDAVYLGCEERQDEKYGLMTRYILDVDGNEKFLDSKSLSLEENLKPLPPETKVKITKGTTKKGNKIYIVSIFVEGKKT